MTYYTYIKTTGEVVSSCEDIADTVVDDVYASIETDEDHSDLSIKVVSGQIVADPEKADKLLRHLTEITRSERDYFLAETDVWALPDRTMTAEQTAYRQALRDITGQAGFPTNITWPTKP